MNKFVRWLSMALPPKYRPQIPAPPAMPRVSNSPVPVDLDGNVKLGIKTLTTLFVIVIGSVVSLMGVWSTLVTRNDVSSVLADHNTRPDAHPEMVKSLREIQNQTISAASRTLRLEEKQAETSENVNYIRSRIDFLTEQTVRQVAERQAAPHASSGRVGDRAVQRLRASGDPHEALDDL